MKLMTSEEFCGNMDAMLEKAFKGERIVITYDGQLFEIVPIRE